MCISLPAQFSMGRPSNKPVCLKAIGTALASKIDGHLSERLPVLGTHPIAPSRALRDETE